jgi:hypothetical protein
MFILLGFSIVTVSAYVYAQTIDSTTPRIHGISSVILRDSALGSIEEGQTIRYSPNNRSDLHQIIKITTTKENVNLHLDSDLDLSVENYATYNIIIKTNTSPRTSYLNEGDTICVLTSVSPDYSTVFLDKAGTYTFDFEITTKAQSVNFDQKTTVTIEVSAESIS